MTPSRPRLSKSRFTLGLRCHRLLWWSAHEPEAPELATLDQARLVGQLARDYVPGGELIDFPYFAVEQKVAATGEALRCKAPAIYEASFLADGVFVGVDILERRRGAYAIIEVKSSTKVKEEYIPDVAIQAHVLRQAGLKVAAAEVMHLNRECVYPDLHDLFVREDVTEQVEALPVDIGAEVEAQRSMLAC